MSDYTAKQKTIVILPKIVSMFSIIGSSFIISMILLKLFKKREKATSYHRLMLGMSICDVMVSFWFFLTTWPIPKGTPDVWGAVGNQATCDAQGWFSQFSIAVVMYNASLSVFYLVKIRFGWHSKRIATKLEPILHAWSLGFGIATSTIAYFLKAYNNDSWECWISPFPLDCKESWKNNGETNCIRGNNASLYRWVLYYAWLWAAILVVIVNMYVVYRGVLQLERRFDRYQDARQYGEVHRKNTRLVARQGYLYCGAFLLTWIFPTITRMVQLITGQTPFPLIVLTSVFVPMQGAFNAVVYIIPRFWKKKKKKKTKKPDTASVSAGFSSSMDTGTSNQRHRNVSSLVYASHAYSVDASSSLHRETTQEDVCVAKSDSFDYSISLAQVDEEQESETTTGIPDCIVVDETPEDNSHEAKFDENQ